MEPSTEIKNALPSYGELISDSFNKVFTAPALFGLVAVFTLVSGVTSLLLEKANLSLPVILVLMLVSLAAGLLNLVATMVVIKGMANPQASVKDLWNETMPQLWSYWWLMIIYTMATLTGLIFLVVPGIILMGYLYLVLNVAALENIKGLDAMVRSTELIRGNWWAVALRMSAVVFLMFLAVLFGGLVFGVLVGTLAAVLGLGEWGTDIASVLLLEPVIVGAATIIIFSATNRIYQSLLGNVSMADEAKVKLRRLYKALAIIGPIALIGLTTFVSYMFIEYGFIMEESFMDVDDSLMYEEMLP